MTWLAATVLLLLAVPFVLWPLLTHQAPETEAAEAADAEAERRREQEERELDG